VLDNPVSVGNQNDSVDLSDVKATAASRDFDYTVSCNGSDTEVLLTDVGLRVPIGTVAYFNWFLDLFSVPKTHSDIDDNLQLSDLISQYSNPTVVTTNFHEYQFFLMDARKLHTCFMVSHLSGVVLVCYFLIILIM
jgi:uncharacterized membrane protein